MCCFIVYFKINGTIIYKTNTTLCWRRLQTSDWAHKSLWNPLTELINQVRSRVILQAVQVFKALPFPTAAHCLHLAVFTQQSWIKALHFQGKILKNLNKTTSAWLQRCPRERGAATCSGAPRWKLGQTWNQNQNYSSVTTARKQNYRARAAVPFLSLSARSRAADQHKFSDREEMRPAPLKKHSVMTWTYCSSLPRGNEHMKRLVTQT